MTTEDTDDLDVSNDDTDCAEATMKIENELKTLRLEAAWKGARILATTALANFPNVEGAGTEDNCFWDTIDHGGAVTG